MDAHRSVCDSGVVPGTSVFKGHPRQLVEVSSILLVRPHLGVPKATLPAVPTHVVADRECECNSAGENRPPPRLDEISCGFQMTLPFAVGLTGLPVTCGMRLLESPGHAASQVQPGPTQKRGT